MSKLWYDAFFQHVTFDYAQRLSEGIAECNKILDFAYDKLLPKSQSTKPPKAEFCPMLNVTECKVSETNDKFVVNVYNPLGRSVDKIVRLPISAPGYQVQDPKGEMIQTQAIPIPKPVLQIPGMFLSQYCPKLSTFLFDKFQFLGQVLTKTLKYCTQLFIIYWLSIYKFLKAL